MTSDMTISSMLTAQSKTTTAKQGLATDFNDFLRLLTTQLQNQDPLSPMDSTEFTNQLVAFTGVEQQINSNQKLDDLIALQLGNAFSGAQSYVGKQVSFVGNEISFDGSPAKIKYSLAKEAASATINVVNESGAVIYSEKVTTSMGAHDFTWNGSLTNGGKAPNGTYAVEVAAFDEDDKFIDSTMVVTGKVRGTETQNGQIYLLVGERAVPLSNVLNTTDGTQAVGDALTMALRYIGMDVTYESGSFKHQVGTSSTLQYSLPEDTESAQAIIKDVDGNVVKRITVAAEQGKHSFTWDGKLTNGTNAHTGSYTVEIDATKVNADPITSKNATYSGNTIETSYTLTGAEKNVRATVLDANNNVVYTKNLTNSTGAGTFAWNGQTTSGGTAPNGSYKIKIDNVASTDSHIAGSVFSSGRVSGVEAQGGSIYLNIGEQAVELSKILNVTLPDEDV